MAQVRHVREVLSAYSTIEGAGVRLHRAFGYGELPHFDPFLMLDDFRAGEDPSDYLAGFPWHPHRGIETVTYMLEGRVEHGDSMGNAGNINGGDVQWMTAGSGIIHQEMPKPVGGKMGGVQLGANLPRSDKMMPPRYQEVGHDRVPVAMPEPGVTVKVICGEIAGVTGPVKDIVTDPVYLDVAIDQGLEFAIPVNRDYTVAAYVIGGEGSFGGGKETEVRNRDMLLFGDGDLVTSAAFDGQFRFLFLSGRPVREPVAWGGPIVMNTEEELQQAFREYRNGTFIRQR
jgi:quercetin 2,3-dioxygenase